MGKIIKVSGPLVVADGMADASMADVVRVGPQHLIGEILNMTGDRASIQVYEETSGLGPGAEVVTTGAPLSVELGPGLIENIYDGIQRPLEEIVRRVGANITRGIQVPPLDREKLWSFTPTAAVGDAVAGGDVLGTVPETESVLHKIMVPNGVSGTVSWLAEAGQYNITRPIARIRTADGAERELTMVQKWPVRVGRPYKKKFPPETPLQSGQRVIDTMFPIAKGGIYAGKLFFTYKEKSEKALTWYGMLAALVIIVLSIKQKQQIALSVYVVPDPLWFYGITICGIYGCLYVTKWIVKSALLTKWMSVVGKNSLHIMALHFLSFKAVDLLLIGCGLFDAHRYPLNGYPTSGLPIGFAYVLAGALLPLGAITVVKLLKKWCQALNWKRISGIQCAPGAD